MPVLIVKFSKFFELSDVFFIYFWEILQFKFEFFAIIGIFELIEKIMILKFNFYDFKAYFLFVDDVVKEVIDTFRIFFRNILLRFAVINAIF